MNIGRSSNPVFTKSVFNTQSYSQSYNEVMTLNGTINKSMALLLLVIVGALYTWNIFFSAIDAESGVSLIYRWMLIGGIGGFVFSLITIFKKTWAYITAPIYAILEGLFLGSISAMFEANFPGLVLQAIALTFGTLLVMLLGYKTGFIKVTQKFKSGVIAATGAVALIYIISFIFSLFGVNGLIIHSNGWLGIAISLAVVAIAALNLVLDFDFIVKGSKAGLPKHMEWYGAFGLMLTLVWLYIEILRLLSKFASRD
ncbi:MAG: Bax inhibitor-1/YccA family protein [Bacteroidales bacterium]|nr:Bax inhibitor-1/YccA family protein [Bacteroidales bacterium]